MALAIHLTGALGLVLVAVLVLVPVRAIDAGKRPVNGLLGLRPRPPSGPRRCGTHRSSSHDRSSAEA